MQVRAKTGLGDRTPLQPQLIWTVVDQGTCYYILQYTDKSGVVRTGFGLKAEYEPITNERWEDVTHLCAIQVSRSGDVELWCFGEYVALIDWGRYRLVTSH